MPALIYIDAAHIHPVIDGTWHRANLTRIPEPGQSVEMLCGLIAAAEFETLDQRSKQGVLVQCARCDVEYRRRRNLAIPKGHPGLIPPQPNSHALRPMEIR